MSRLRQVRALFRGAAAARREGQRGVVLRFEPERPRLEVEVIEDFADLGPELTLPAVIGLGKVLRLLRAARIALPNDARALLGREHEVAKRLGRALGTAVWLTCRARARVRFVAWTESGVETVEDVIDVLENPESFLLLRSRGRPPLAIRRDQVVRQRTESEPWYEVIDIERA